MNFPASYVKITRFIPRNQLRLDDNAPTVYFRGPYVSAQINAYK